MGVPPLLQYSFYKLSTTTALPTPVGWGLQVFLSSGIIQLPRGHPIRSPLVTFSSLGHLHLQLKEWDAYFGCFRGFNPCIVNDINSRIWQKKAPHLMISRKQRLKGGLGGDIQPPTSCHPVVQFSRPDATSQQQVKRHRPIIQSPPQHTGFWGSY